MHVSSESIVPVLAKLELELKITVSLGKIQYFHMIKNRLMGSLEAAMNKSDNSKIPTQVKYMQNCSVTTA